jgi:predicted acyltransferase
MRGLAVLGMVLSGHLAFGIGTAGDPAGVLPAWMYHAQLPPPTHKYQPTLAGLTWVDLVFPLFLFALGAAIPLALGRQAEAEPNRLGRPWTGTWPVLRVAARRFGLLLFLALFFQHLKPASVAGTTLAAYAQPLALLALAALVLALGPWRWPWRTLGGVLSTVLLLGLRQADGDWAFALKRSDIILVVLANMALVGTLLWWWTRQRPVWRWALLVPLALVLYGAKAPGSVNAWLLQASPAPWAMQVAYLKYLVIVLPATFVGERLWRAGKGGAMVSSATPLAAGCALLVVGVLIGLQARAVPATLLAAALLAGGIAWQAPALRPAFWLLLCGLLLEPLEGGIRKDGLNLSYVLVTSGLGWFVLAALHGLAGRAGAAVLALFAASGRNALLAYVLAALLVLPLLQLTGLHAAWAGLDGSALDALLRGVLITAAVMALVALANRAGCVLKA